MYGERFRVTGYASPHSVGHRIAEFEQFLRIKEALRAIKNLHCFTVVTNKHARNVCTFELALHKHAKFNLSTDLYVGDYASLIVVNLDYRDRVGL